jgi:hypothetical protein
MRMLLNIPSNTTIYQTRDLRKIVLTALKQFRDPPVYPYVVSFAHGKRKCANCQNEGVIIGIGNREIECDVCPTREVSITVASPYPYRTFTVYLPRVKTGVPEGVVASLAQCLARVLKGNTSYPSRYSQSGQVEMPEWMEGVYVSVREPKPPPSMEQRVDTRKAKVEAMLAKWLRRYKLAGTKVKALRRKIAYYEKRKTG